MANELNIPGFKHYELDSTYQAKLAAGEVNAKDLSFVKETGKIYTQGGKYGGGDVEIIKVYAPPQPNSVEGLTESQIAENAEAFTRIWDSANAGKPFLIYINGVIHANNIMADSDGSFIRITAPMFFMTNYGSYRGMAKIYMELALFPDGRSYYEELEEEAPNPEGGSGTNIVVDTAMSDSSENAVQNKVIKAYVDNAVANTGGGSGNYLEIRELKMNDDMTVTEEQKAYNIETFNKAQAGEAFALSAMGVVLDLGMVISDVVLFSLLVPNPFGNRELISIGIALFPDGTFNPSQLDYCARDTEMSDESENAVQNKVVKKYIDDAVAGAITTTLNTAV